VSLYNPDLDTDGRDGRAVVPLVGHVAGMLA
jgi:hypothetical protein